MKCVKCGAKMVVRQNKKNNQSFWGCKNYPKCTHTEKFEQVVIPEEPKEFLPARIRKIPPKKRGSKAEKASYECWRFFHGIGVKDVEIICDTLLSYYESKGKHIQSLKSLDTAYLYASKYWDDFKKFSKAYLIGINIKYHEPTPTSGATV